MEKILCSLNEDFVRQGLTQNPATARWCDPA